MKSMPKVSYKIITLEAVALFVFLVCGGGGGCPSAPALNLSGLWSFTTSAGTVGTLDLTQHGEVWWLGRIYGARITGTLTAPYYRGIGKENPTTDG